MKDFGFAPDILLDSGRVGDASTSSVASVSLILVDGYSTFYSSS